jgi:hypothetical protein
MSEAISGIFIPEILAVDFVAAHSGYGLFDIVNGLTICPPSAAAVGLLH